MCLANNHSNRLKPSQVALAHSLLSRSLQRFQRFQSFDLSLSFNLATRPQTNSPNGPISNPFSFAFSLLACLSAYLAAIPCIMTLLRNTPKASPHPLSELGSHPAISAYQAMHWERDGSPGVDADVEKA